METMTIGLPFAVQILEGTGLPFVIRSPESVRELRGLAACDAPGWWGPKMDGEWVLVCVNHDTHERLVGMGTCVHNAILDLDDGFSKSPSGIRLEIPPEFTRKI